MGRNCAERWASAAIILTDSRMICRLSVKAHWLPRARICHAASPRSVALDWNRSWRPPPTRFCVPWEQMRVTARAEQLFFSTSYPYSLLSNTNDTDIASKTSARKVAIKPLGPEKTYRGLRVTFLKNPAVVMYIISSHPGNFHLLPCIRNDT